MNLATWFQIATPIQNPYEFPKSPALIASDIDETLILNEIDKKVKCECGAEICGSSGHSTWCPKFNTMAIENCTHVHWVWTASGHKLCLDCNAKLDG